MWLLKEDKIVKIVANFWDFIIILEEKEIKMDSLVENIVIKTFKIIINLKIEKLLLIKLIKWLKSIQIKILDINV
jgi:hypothetical protein